MPGFVQEAMKVWITKYALTTGVFVMNAEIVDGKYASGGNVFTIDFVTSETEAKGAFERKRKAKIASLKKQITKLEAAKFTVRK